MLLDDLLNENKKSPMYGTIMRECSQFFEQSTGLTMLKKQHTKYTDFKKVKVRFNNKSQSSKKISQAFNEKTNNLIHKAIVCNHPSSILDVDGHLSYVLPINGYKFIYNVEVSNSKKELNNSSNSLYSTIKNDELSDSILSDLVKYTYVDYDLHEGLKANAEIIIYNIPYYYTVSITAIQYDKLLRK